MIPYFTRVLFILAHCLTDNIYLHVFLKKIVVYCFYSLMYFFFLNKLLVLGFLGPLMEISVLLCALMCYPR